MNIPLDSFPKEKKQWYNNPTSYIFIVVLILVLIIILLTGILFVQNRKKNNPTHTHYTRLITEIHHDGYELYRLNVLQDRNPAEQYKRFADFLRRSLFNRSNYEKNLPSCPIIYAMSLQNHPTDWRGMLFGTTKYPNKNPSHSYVCYLSVLPSDRNRRLGSILLNQFIKEISQETDPSPTHIQLHTNWENCGAQKLYRQCGFRCNEFTLNGYSEPFESEYKFGHMIQMELNLANIKDLANICLMQNAVTISSVDENNYTKLCDANRPNELNKKC